MLQKIPSKHFVLTAATFLTCYINLSLPADHGLFVLQTIHPALGEQHIAVESISYYQLRVNLKRKETSSDVRPAVSRAVGAVLTFKKMKMFSLHLALCTLFNESQLITVNDFQATEISVQSVVSI